MIVAKVSANNVWTTSMLSDAIMSIVSEAFSAAFCATKAEMVSVPSPPPT